MRGGIAGFLHYRGYQVGHCDIIRTWDGAQSKTPIIFRAVATYSLRCLLSQPTDATPIAPNMIAPGSGTTGGPEGIVGPS